MAYVISNPVGGGLPGINPAGATQFGTQGISETSTTKRYPLGTRVRGIDPVYGEAEFVYCLGVASTAVGDVVTIDGAWATARSGARSKGLIGVAMSANIASQYGWYCIFGVVPAKAGTVAAGAQAYFTATAAQVDDAVVAGDFLAGAGFATADGTPSAGLAMLRLAYSAGTDADNA